MYYPEIYGDDNDTSSYFSANSSAYNTPQSIQSNAHGLLAKYNQSKRSSNKSKKAPNLMNSKSRSTSIRRHNKDNDGRPKLKPRDNSRANKSHSHSKQDRKASIHKKDKRNRSASIHQKDRKYRSASIHKKDKKNKKKAYITDTNTPTMSASNDAILRYSKKRFFSHKCISFLYTVYITFCMLNTSIFETFCLQKKIVSFLINICRFCIPYILFFVYIKLLIFYVTYL